MRRRILIIVALGAIPFLAFSAELARYLSGVTSERNAVYKLLEAQARGDAPGMITRIDGCAQDAACATRMRALAVRLKQPAGRLKILNYESSTRSTLGTKTGEARAAWSIVERDTLPIVQCVTVTHRWSFVHGSSVTLRRLSAPIDNEAGC